MIQKTRSILPKLGVLAFWLAVWQVVCLLVNKPVLLASPLAVCRALAALLPEGSFWLTVGCSLGRISAGFALAFAMGLLVGAAGWRFPFLAQLLSPLLTVMKAVPVASFVILTLVWFGSGVLSVIVSFFIVFPQIYFAVISGLSAADPQLLEMARVFRFTRWQTFYEIYRPPLLRFLISACSSALGMSWKSGIAAEVIGIPDHSIGEALYLSKVYMMTAELFAWTLVIIGLSVIFEKLVLLLLRKAGR